MSGESWGAGELRYALGPPGRRAGKLPQGPGPADAPAGDGPQVLAADEITHPADLRAMETAAGRVTLLATAHGGGWEELSLRPSTGNCWGRGSFKSLSSSPWRQGGGCTPSRTGEGPMTAALAGKALLFLGCTALGGAPGAGPAARAACLQVFRRVLAALARELAFSLRPLDQLMARAQEGSQGPVADFFRACRQAFTAGGRESWADSWATALEATPLP